jgi:HD-GYP domain-containing protein (c-di-GMP phosphodiesterase class II)
MEIPKYGSFSSVKLSDDPSQSIINYSSKETNSLLGEKIESISFKKLISGLGEDDSLFDRLLKDKKIIFVGKQGDSYLQFQAVELDNVFYGAVIPVSEEEVIREINTSSEIIRRRIRLNRIVAVSDEGGHRNRIGIYAHNLAQMTCIDKHIRDSIESAAEYHDIGKPLLNQDILYKPDRLNNEEYEHIKLHTQLGGALISGFDELFYEGRIVRAHHEGFIRGNGYPGLKSGEEIPLSARIVAIADAWDALRSERCYKLPYSFERAINLMKNGENGRFDPRKHFDPYLLEEFIKNSGKFEFPEKIWLARSRSD